MYVEKEGYNPYIEIIKGDEQEKVVYLKQPNDDIEIYSAMLFYAGEYFNVLTQECQINNDLLPTHYSELTINTNVIADEYHILVNGESRYFSDEPTFHGIMFDELNPEDKLSVQVIYQDIESKILDTFISVEELKFDEEEINRQVRVARGNIGINVDTGDQDLGVFDNFNFDFSKLAELLGKNTLSKILKPLNFEYDVREGTYTIRIGFDWDIQTKKMKDDEKKMEELSEQIYQNCEKMKSLDDAINEETAKLKYNQEKLKELEQNSAEYGDEIKRLKSQRKQSINRMHNLRGKKKENAPKMKQYQEELQKTIDDVKATKKECDDKVKDYLNKVQNGEWNINDLTSRLNLLEHFTQSDIAKFNQSGKSISFGLEIFGIFKYNVKRHVAEELSISVSGKFGFSWKGMFLAYVVPCYYGVNIEAKIGADLNFIRDYNDEEDKKNQKQFDFIPLERFWESIKLKFGVSATGELGIGVCDILSVGGFLKFEYAGEVYPGAYDFLDNSKWGHKIDISIGVKATALVWDWEHSAIWTLLDQTVTKPDYSDKEDSNSENTPNNGENNNEGDSNNTENSENNNAVEASKYYSNFYSATANMLSRSNYLNSHNKRLNNIAFYNSYQESKPQIITIEGKSILTWIEDDLSRTDLNRTVLKYAILENGVWSETKSILDNGTADYYHEMYYDGQDLHIVWQKMSNKIDSNDLIAVSSASEIYYAKFNKTSNKFESVKRLTNDATGDFAPKFALKEKASDPLTIIWRKNSNNDIFGMTGENYLYSITFDGANWIQPKCEYNSNKYFSFTTAAYKNEELMLAFTEFDGLEIDSNRYIKVVNEADIRIIATGEKLNNTNFTNVDGSSMLSYFDGEQIVISRDLLTLETFKNLDSIRIGEDFKILNDSTIVYKKLQGNDKSQIYCATYNKVTERWNYDIKITEEELSIIKWSASLDNNGQVVVTYNGMDENENCVTCVVTREFKSDFEVMDVFIFDKPVINSNNTFTFKIYNSGDFVLDDIVITGYGITHTIDSVIGVGEIGYIDLEFNVSRFSENEVFTISAGGKSKEYVLSTAFVDIKLIGEVVIENGEQKFIITIINDSDFVADCIINIYINGKLLKSEDILVEALEEKKLTFILDNLNIGDSVCFDIVSDKEDVNNCDNTKIFSSLIDTNKNIIQENIYKQLLSQAKGFLI